MLFDVDSFDLYNLVILTRIAQKTPLFKGMTRWPSNDDYHARLDKGADDAIERVIAVMRELNKSTPEIARRCAPHPFGVALRAIKSASPICRTDFLSVRGSNR